MLRYSYLLSLITLNINNTYKRFIAKKHKITISIKLASFKKFQHLLFYLVKLKNKIKIFDSRKQFIRDKPKNSVQMKNNDARERSQLSLN